MHPADYARSNREKTSEMASLSHAIQSLHQSLVEVTDPDAVSKLTGALNTLTSVQAEMTKPYVGPERRT